MNTFSSLLSFPLLLLRFLPFLFRLFFSFMLLFFPLPFLSYPFVSFPFHFISYLLSLSFLFVSFSRFLFGTDSFTCLLNECFILFEGKCTPKVTAIELWTGDQKTYIFNAANFWRLDDGKSSHRGYPKQISSKWQGVPDNIDEMFLWGRNWNVYFFKGHQYYRYNNFNNQTDPNYPQNVSQGWRGLPADGIDAGFTLSVYTSYFFKGSKVYKYDNINDQVASGYPKQITDDWPGIPNNIDSVFRWLHDGKTYFFKDLYYWTWNNTTRQAEGPFLIRDTWKNICNI